ncbi:ion transport peptide-like isoform X1 [Dinothrombium tinctorium]|uniref:Ion transport peptide-like isoform X1 n=3 Tax=Dinothrombium tinctorium TaxID=1965070 RepID=A0A3S4Q7A0_9ACAR|nr:ion transport peptide-like isoform X1 [Dinothrombium tinctorium]
MNSSIGFLISLLFLLLFLFNLNSAIAYPYGRGCRGIDNQSYSARLDRVCYDCYNLFREPKIYLMCTQDCFTSDYFKACLDALFFDEDEVEYFKKMIKQLHGASPEF